MKQVHTFGGLDQTTTSPTTALNNNNNNVKSMMMPMKMDNSVNLPFPQPHQPQSSPYTLPARTVAPQPIANNSASIEPATSTSQQSATNSLQQLAQFTQFSDAFVQQQRLLAMRAVANGSLDEFQLQQLRNSFPLFHSLPIGQSLAGLLPPPLAGRKREHDEETLKEMYGKMQRSKFGFNLLLAY
jgi:hypothetical protein